MSVLYPSELGLISQSDRFNPVYLISPNFPVYRHNIRYCYPCQRWFWSGGYGFWGYGIVFVMSDLTLNYWYFSNPSTWQQTLEYIRYQFIPLQGDCVYC